MADEVTPLELSRIFSSHPRLHTERLTLRATTLNDAAAIFDYASDPIATEIMTFPRHQSIQDSITFIEYNAECFKKRERLAFAIALKDSNEPIGTCDFHHIAPEHRRTEIGYIMRRSFWGKGYMTETVRELIRFAFDEMGMHRVEALCNAVNERSARVMERCGMTLEGTFRDNEVRKGIYVTTKAYAIVHTSG